MSAAAIATLVKMVESLPDALQDHVVEHLRDYLADLDDETRWDTLFQKTQANLVAAARQAKDDIAAGQAVPLDYEKL